uniref:Uncharacterized protein n=1 Tax=Daphnia galeata TaxID=27404 RepID=A0A8J2RS28_9CRUS|nr:unnamed protein product [Daphnia galeata]
MAYKNLVSASLAAVLLFICCGAFFFGFVTSQDTDALSGDQQTSAQYYRPYNVNRRTAAYPVRRPAAYPVRRPAYNNYINNQRPQAPVSSNYRPSAPTVAAQPNNNRPSTSGTTCTSSNSYGQYGICWAADSQRLQIGPNLTIENLFSYVFDCLSSAIMPTEPTLQQRWSVVCVSTGEDDCNYHRGNNVYTSAAQSCINDDCICVVGEPYETIASQTDSPNNPFKAPEFQPGYWQSWTAGLNQDIQNTLAASGTINLACLSLSHFEGSIIYD